MPTELQIAPFEIKDCTLAAIATGRRAQNLKELREELVDIHPGSIYYHFWGERLRPELHDPLYNNDFATWARHGLHDGALAERLSVLDPTDFPDLEDLRRELIELIEERLDESPTVPWSKADQQFHFIRSNIVIFDTARVVTRPDEFAAVIPTLSLGSIFYHFIDARRRESTGLDDFRTWLGLFGDAHRELVDRIADIDPYFLTLLELRTALGAVFAA